MPRKLLGVLFLLLAVALLSWFYFNRTPSDIQSKGGIRVFGVDLNDLVSLLGGIVSLASGVVTLSTARRKHR